MAKLELAAAESRRKVAEKLLKKAKVGCLVSISSTTKLFQLMRRELEHEDTHSIFL